jgi:hypothetical protein
MNDSHFHLIDPTLPKGKAEGQREHTDNSVEALAPRVDCEHCITTKQGQPRQRTVKETAEIRALNAKINAQDQEIAALRAAIEGRVDIGNGAVVGSRRDPNEEVWQQQEAEEDAERARKRAEREAAAAAKKGK